MLKTSTIILILLSGAKLSAQKPLVSVNPSQYAFYGFDNKIVIHCPKSKIKAFKLISIDSFLCPLRHRDGSYYLKPSSFMSNSKHQCQLIILSGSKIIDTFNVQLLSASKTIPSIGATNGYIDKEKLLKVDSIQLVNEFNFHNFQQRVTKFRAIIMPKSGYMSEINLNGNRFDTTIKKLFSELNAGDLVVFDAIRAKSNLWVGEKPLNPFYVTITNSPKYNQNFNTMRVTGFVKQRDIVTPYIYPISTDDELNNNLERDSLWHFYFYNFEEDSFRLQYSHLYRNNDIVKLYFYDIDKNSRSSYFVETKINDSMFYYEQFYKNGKLYQKGIVKINTPFSKHRKFKFANETSIVNKPVYLKALEDMSDDCFPMGYWQVFDSTGYLKATVNWDFAIEPNAGIIDETDPKEPILFRPSDYYCKPKGEVVIYNSKGEIIERLFPEE